MINITQVDHLGLRVSDIKQSVDCYQRLGFAFIRDAGFIDGHPGIMKHPSGMVINLLAPSTKDQGTNVLMDVEDKYSGFRS